MGKKIFDVAIKTVSLNLLSTFHRIILVLISLTVLWTKKKMRKETTNYLA